MPRQIPLLLGPDTRLRLCTSKSNSISGQSSTKQPMSAGSTVSWELFHKSALCVRSQPNMSPNTVFRSVITVAILTTTGLFPPAAAIWNVNCSASCHCFLQASEFTHQMALRTVNCSYQLLKSLPPDLPKDAEVLLVPGNYLNEMYHYIPDLLELKELDMSSNRLRSLGRGYIFHNLSGLIYLSLAKNELAALVQDAFSGLINLQVLILSGNKISDIQDQAFHGLNSLQILDLGQNQLSSLYPEWFYGLSNLKQLHIYENRIHLVNSATFVLLRRLQHLSLHGNRINHIVGDGFLGLGNLDTLHLERNYLQDVPTAAFQGMPSLKALYLSGNSFAVLRSGDFVHLSFEELILNSLPYLRLVEAGAFRNLTRLNVLEMHDCRNLAYIDAKAFINVTVLHHFDLQNNNLSTVPHEMASELPTGCEVALKGNPLLCDCNARWIREELNMAEWNNSQIHFLEAEQLVCNSPVHVRSIPLLHLDPTTALPVQCAPSIFPLMEASIEKQLGDQLILNCRATGNPAPSIHWTLPSGRTLDLSSNDVHMQLRPSGTLFYYHLKEDDTGKYTCMARNAEGSAEFHIALRVKRIDIHIFPIIVSSTFATLVWNGTARNSFPKFIILYRLFPSSGGMPNCLTNASSQSYQHVTVSPFYRSYTVSNLLPESTYEFCLAFEDHQGYEVCISCTVLHTMDAGYMQQGIHRTSNVAVAVVLGIIVTMVMVICFVTVAARKYRQRQYICPDKPIIHRMSHIPLENLYSPLMSNAGP